jgi:hypothetical protein
VNPASLSVGISTGISLSFAVVVFAVVGLGPWFTWVPDEVLIIAVAAVGVIDLARAGARGRRLTGWIRDGATAAALAGAIAGVAAGMCFVLFGNGIENLVVLPLIGAVSGIGVGTIAAWWRR